MKKTYQVIFLFLFSFININNSFAKNKQNIVVLATGGTIAGAGKTSHDAKYVPAKLTIQELLDLNPELKKIANLTGEQFSQIASQDMDSDFLIKLAKRVSKILDNSSIDGVVITHGTDTLEETAYFLNLTVKTKKPIVIVGSMRPSTSISADGSLNLYNAIALAADSKANSKGVLVILNDNIYAARDVTKLHTSNVAAFDSKEFGPIGNVIYGKVKFYYQSTKIHTYQSKFNIDEIKSLPKVDIIYGYNDQNPDIVDSLINSGTKAIVVAGVGDGNVNAKTLEKLINASKKGIIIVRSSRVGGGFVIPNSEINDDEYSFVTADNLNPQKARIVTMLALSKSKDYKKIQEDFKQY
jgi:L-asparaginase